MTPFSYMTHRAIEALQPGSEFKVKKNDLDTIEWLNGTAPLPHDQILTKTAEFQAEYDAQEYARNRQAEYPPIGDQLDALFHAGVFPADMAAQLQAVKDKYPKV